MKTNISKISLIVALGLSVAGTAYAHEDYSEAGSIHWISHVAESKGSPSAKQFVAGTAHEQEFYSETGSIHWISDVAESKGSPSANQLATYGYAAKKGADREITLTSTSKYLNVTRMETVRINVDGKSVVWTFDTLGTAFPLAKVIPGMDGITVYVAENRASHGS